MSANGNGAVTRPASTRHLTVALALLTAAVMASSLIPAQSADALPGTCRVDEVWHNGTTYQRDDGTIVETGIGATRRWVCDVVDPPSGDPGSGSGAGPAVPSPPAAPGPLLPKPPDSVPPTAGPKCVAGSTNATRPGAATDDGTGDGSAVIDTVNRMLGTGDLEISYSPGANIVTLDVNLGPSASGQAEANPMEGLSAFDAEQALWWPSAADPLVTEAGTASFVKKAVKLAIKGARGNAQARQAFTWMMQRIDTTLRLDIEVQLRGYTESILESYHGTIPPDVRAFILDLWELIDQIIEMTSDEMPMPSAPSLYADVAGLPSERGGTARLNQGACGQVLQTKVEAGAAAGLTATGPTARITLVGTRNGTLVSRLGALARPELSCPMVTKEAIVGQENLLQVADGCVGEVTGVRVLTRAETSALPAARKAELMNGAEAEPLASSVLLFEHSPWVGDDVHLPGPSATSSVGAERTTMVGATKDGTLSYATTGRAAVDLLVLAARDSAGVEHPFLVKIVLVQPPSCDKRTDRIVGPSLDGFVPRLKGDKLKVIRNTPFMLDLKSLCSTDPRHRYRVEVTSTMAGLTARVDDAGAVRFEWTDPGVVGDDLDGLTVRAWDETTGAPGPEVQIKADVKDVQAECNDAEVDYDRSELKGEPLVIPIDCAMVGGLQVLTRPFLRLDDSPRDGYEKVVEGGVFRSDGTVLTFTPSDVAVEVATAQLSPWSSDPMLPAEAGHVHGASFSVDVRFAD